jgi:hypothetical protein
LVNRYERFGGIPANEGSGFSETLLSSKLHVVRSQKTVIYLFNIVRNSNLTFMSFIVSDVHVHYSLDNSVDFSLNNGGRELKAGWKISVLKYLE